MALTDEEVIEQLSHRPRQIIGGVINVPELSHSLFVPVSQEHQNPLGRLQVLPLEILHGCLEYFNLVTLQRLSRVSLRANAVVTSLPKLKILVSVAWGHLTILAQTKVLKLHSVNVLYSALCSDRCGSCGAYGTFLLLLSAQRCCLTCMLTNHSLCVIPIGAAERCFGANYQDLVLLPTLRSNRGPFNILGVETCGFEGTKLLGVEAAVALAVQKYGSMKQMDERLAAYNLETCSYSDRFWLHYRGHSIQPASRKPLSIRQIKERWTDPYAGHGAVHFPSYANGHISQGYWCRGCEDAYMTLCSGGMVTDALARSVPQGWDLAEYIETMCYRAWSKAEFVQHTKFCHPTITDAR